MSPKINLDINQKLFVSKNDLDWYVTSIQDNDEYTFSIALPYLASHPLVLYRGDKIYCKMPADGASFLFETKVVRFTADQVPLYVLAIPKEYQRIQQRRFVRLPVLFPVGYVRLPEDDQEELVFEEAMSVDLSGSGMRIATGKSCKPGTRLKVRFQLKIRREITDFELEGEVMRLELKQKDKGNPVYHMGVEFRNISRQEQDQIVAFVFAKMVEQRQLR